MVVGSRSVAYFQQYAKFKRKQWAIERPCTLYSIDFCAFDSGKHKQMWMCKWDPDAVAWFNLTTNSCVLLDALCSQLCSLSCVLWVVFSVLCSRTFCRPFLSHTWSCIDYNGFALAFISDQYIIYTIYIQVCSITCAELWLCQHTSWSTFWLEQQAYITCSNVLSGSLCTHCSFSASAYPFCHNWCAVIKLSAHFMKQKLQCVKSIRLVSNRIVQNMKSVWV